MTLTDTPIGKDCVLAYDQPANWDTPSWEAIENAVDVSQPNIKKGTVDVPSRGSQGWKFKAPTMKENGLAVRLPVPAWPGRTTGKPCVTRS